MLTCTKSCHGGNAPPLTSKTIAVQSCRILLHSKFTGVTAAVQNLYLRRMLMHSNFAAVTAGLRTVMVSSAAVLSGYVLACAVDIGKHGNLVSRHHSMAETKPDDPFSAWYSVSMQVGPNITTACYLLHCHLSLDTHLH